MVPGSPHGNWGSGLGLRNPVCADAMKTPIDVLQCPSDSPPKIRDQQRQWQGTDVFVTNYKGVMGDNRMGGSASPHPGSEPDCHHTRNCNGLFWRNNYLNPIRIDDIRDGTSNTLPLPPVEHPCRRRAGAGAVNPTALR